MIGKSKKITIQTWDSIVLDGIDPPFDFDFPISKITVKSQHRVLKAQYTFELAEDLMCVHGIDVLDLPQADIMRGDRLI